MQYEIVAYQSRDAFNQDADTRYQEVLRERHPMSYDRFWIVQQVLEVEEFRIIVLWARPAPLRKS